MATPDTNRANATATSLDAGAEIRPRLNAALVASVREKVPRSLRGPRAVSLALAYALEDWLEGKEFSRFRGESSRKRKNCKGLERNA